MSFVAKEELAHQFVAGYFLRRIGTLFARRFDPRAGIEDTEAQLQAARAGERIVSMPEGTLTRMPGLLSFHMGAFLVAAEAGIPVDAGDHNAARAQRSAATSGSRAAAASVCISEPRSCPSGAGFEAALRLRDAARAKILSRCGEPDLAHERPI